MSIGNQDWQALLTRIRDCRLCAEDLPHGPRPVVQAHPEARLAIVGQAPGRAVHQSGVPWQDPSGDRLREWLHMDAGRFYNPRQVALIPMGFCYPGKGASGDLPPMAVCAPTWHNALFQALPELQTVLLVGQYAQRHYLEQAHGRNLTETVKAWQRVPAPWFPLPHPSPRNRLWLRRNPWFEVDVLPALRKRVEGLWS